MHVLLLNGEDPVMEDCPSNGELESFTDQELSLPGEAPWEAGRQGGSEHCGREVRLQRPSSLTWVSREFEKST